MNTPRTNEALAALLERDGELSEDNAPAVLVKLCKELEATTQRQQQTKPNDSNTN